MSVNLKSMAGSGSLLLGLAGALLFLYRLPPTRLPQGQMDKDILSILLGDAKKDISSSMVRTADSYFHGGVDIDCHLEEGGSEKHVCSGDCPHHHADRDCPHAEQVSLETGHASRNSHFDPWKWINLHIRAPEIDRHLGQEKAHEMLPWFWAAVRSDPHNVEAWTATWYVAASIMKDADLARRVVEEGLRNNPDSIELVCLLGRTFRLDRQKDDAKAEAAFASARTIGLQKCANDLEKLAEADKLEFLKALDYLSLYLSARKDLITLERIYQEAKRVRSDHVVVRNLKRRLDETSRH